MLFASIGDAGGGSNVAARGLCAELGYAELN